MIVQFLLIFATIYVTEAEHHHNGKNMTPGGMNNHHIKKWQTGGWFDSGRERGREGTSCDCQGLCYYGCDKPFYYGEWKASGKWIIRATEKDSGMKGQHWGSDGMGWDPYKGNSDKIVGCFDHHCPAGTKSVCDRNTFIDKWWGNKDMTLTPPVCKCESTCSKYARGATCNEVCKDADNGQGDKDGDGCDRYRNNPHWCTKYDTKLFDSASMCCACEGGKWEEEDLQCIELTGIPVQQRWCNGIFEKIDDVTNNGNIAFKRRGAVTMYLFWTSREGGDWQCDRDLDEDFRKAIFSAAKYPSLPVTSGNVWYNGQWNPANDVKIEQVDCPSKGP